ncbi:hypothetical protein [Bacteroides sp.]
MVEKKTTKKKVQGVDAEAQTLCEKLGVSKLWRNSRGEYFTERTYALASEGGDKTKISVYDTDAVVSTPEVSGEGEKKSGAEDKPEEK